VTPLNPNMDHVLRIEALARGGEHPAAGMYLVEYDTKRPPRPVELCPVGSLSSEHCLLVLHPDREKAMEAGPHKLMEMWRQSCACGTIQPSGRVCRPLTAFTISILPLDAT
jgi:hypothetical protein